MEIRDWVIDVDTHITEPADLWTSRVPAKFKDRAPRLVRNPENQWDTWQVGNSKPIVPVGFTAVAGWKEPFPSAPRNLDECPPASYDAKARLAYMDSIGVWAMAIYPNVGGFGSQEFLKLGDRELMLACVRAYNDFLIDWCSADPRRFIPIASTPFWDVDAAVVEMERAAKIGHKGVLFTGEPQVHGMPLLGSPHWSRFWAAAQDLELPVSFHIGTGSFDGGFTKERMELTGMGSTNAVVAVNLFLDNGKQLVDLLFSGVLPRHPRLKVISVESGIGFIPFILESCDYTFGYSQVRKQRPEFTLLPSEYFKRQVYGCYFYEELAPQLMLDKIGVDNVLFETDYPHPVCLYGNVRQKIDAGLRGQPEGVKRKLLWENAAKLYKVGAPDRAWTPPAA
jgi:predicted TIM-barrel fold metal-dependent hydrolase